MYKVKQINSISTSDKNTFVIQKIFAKYFQSVDTIVDSITRSIRDNIIFAAF